MGTQRPIQQGDRLGTEAAAMLRRSRVGALPHGLRARRPPAMARPLLVDFAMLVVAGGGDRRSPSHLAGVPGAARHVGRLLRRAGARDVRHPRHVQRAAALAPARRDPPDRVRHRGRDDGGDLAARRRSRTTRTPPAQTAQTWILAAVCLSVGRTGLFIARARAIARGEGGRPTLIVGAGRVGHLVARRLHGAPRVRPAPGRLPRQRPARDRGRARPTLPVLGASWDLERVLEEHDVEHVDLHLLHRAARGDAEHGAPLPRAGRVRLARAAPVRGRRSSA